MLIQRVPQSPNSLRGSGIVLVVVSCSEQPQTRWGIPVVGSQDDFPGTSWQHSWFQDVVGLLHSQGMLLALLSTRTPGSFFAKLLPSLY